MRTKWCHNAKTGEIFSYNEWRGGATDLPYGVLLAYDDYLTTGLASEEDAEIWASEWHACLECKSARRGAIGELCVVCGAPLVGATF